MLQAVGSKDQICRGGDTALLIWTETGQSAHTATTHMNMLPPNPPPPNPPAPPPGRPPIPPLGGPKLPCQITCIAFHQRDSSIEQLSGLGTHAKATVTASHLIVEALMT